MYGVTGEKRSIFVKSDAFLYNLSDPIQRIPENRKLPYPASVYYITYATGQAEEG